MNKEEIVSLIEKDFATKKVADYLTDMPADVKTLFSYLDNKFDHKSTSVGMPVKFDNPRVRDFFHLAQRAINGRQYGDNDIDHKAIFIKKYGQKTYDAILKVLDNNRIYLKNGGFISIDTSKFGAGKIERIVFMFPQIYSGVDANVDLYLKLKDKKELSDFELSFISEVEKIINKADLDNFDWESFYRESTPEEKAAFELKQKEEAENEKENWYQQSKWSKKYAPTYKDAVEKTKKEYLDSKKTFEDWGSRVYKSNKDVVYAGGDDIHGDAYTIGGINENRKRNVLKGAKMQMDEAIANLKELGVPEAEINELVEQKENKEMTKTVGSDVLGDVEFTAKGGNKVVDEKGYPLVVYHGTGEDFEDLDETMQNSATGHGDFGRGFYFSAKEGIAKYYSLKFKNRVVKKFNINVKNPFEINIKDEVFDERTKKALRSLKYIRDYESDIIRKATDGGEDFGMNFGYKQITKGLGDKRFSDILKENGYDAVFVNRTLGGETTLMAEIVVFDKSKIKELSTTNKEQSITSENKGKEAIKEQKNEVKEQSTIQEVKEKENKEINIEEVKLIDTINYNVDGDIQLKEIYEFGYSNIQLLYTLENKNLFQIAGLFVAEKDRRNGVGSKLIDFAKKRAAELQFDEILYLLADYEGKDYDDLVSFCKKNGFEFVGKSDKKMIFKLSKENKEMAQKGRVTNDELDKAVSDLHKAETLQETMKKANAIIRSKKNVTERLISEAGMSESSALKAQQPDYAGRIGFATYQLTNNNASIKRLQERVKMLEKKVEGAKAAESGAEEKYTFDGGVIKVNYEEDRVQILLDSVRADKPMYQMFRKNGYVFSPTNKAFQRKITPQAIRNAVQLMKATKVSSEPKIEKEIVKTEEVFEPNTGDEFDEVIMANIDPKDQWKGHLMKERDVKLQIYSQLSGAEDEKEKEVERLFQLYASKFEGEVHKQHRGLKEAAEKMNAEFDAENKDKYYTDEKGEVVRSEINELKGLMESENKKNEYDFNNLIKREDVSVKEVFQGENLKTIKFEWNGGFYKWAYSFSKTAGSLKVWKFPTEKDLMSNMFTTGVKEEIIYNTFNTEQTTDEGSFIEFSVSKWNLKEFFKGSELDKISVVVKEAEPITDFKGVNYSYKNQYELNKAIEALLIQRAGTTLYNDSSEYTSDEKNFLRKYSGYGGLDKYGTTGKGGLFEYYTPKEIIERMWALAYKYGYNNGSVLEPSIGIGEFLQYAPKDVRIAGYEINEFSAKICKILYPTAEINVQPFEKTFISKNNWTMKDNLGSLEKFDLVIGNPPYGDFSIVESRYMSGMGEKDHTKARNYVEYFIRRGLDLLKSGGLLIYIVGAQLKNGGNMFLDSGETPVKDYLAANCELLDAYRLPDSVFERTGVTSDIIVLKKL
jgi:GNAT superfamily N-acetyltransferase